MGSKCVDTDQMLPRMWELRGVSEPRESRRRTYNIERFLHLINSSLDIQLSIQLAYRKIREDLGGYFTGPLLFGIPLGLLWHVSVRRHSQRLRTGLSGRYRYAAPENRRLPPPTIRNANPDVDAFSPIRLPQSRSSLLDEGCRFGPPIFNPDMQTVLVDTNSDGKSILPSTVNSVEPQSSRHRWQQELLFQANHPLIRSIAAIKQIPSNLSNPIEMCRHPDPELRVSRPHLKSVTSATDGGPSMLSK